MSSGATKAGSSWHLLTKSDYVTGRRLHEQPVAGSRAEEKPTGHRKKEEARGRKRKGTGTVCDAQMLARSKETATLV